MRRINDDYRTELNEIGNKLARLRIQKGYESCKAFALAYDLPPIQYWRIENGKANITLKSLTRILHIHQVSMEDFFCMKSDKAAA